ncbi:sensor domain-containing protein [Prosthecomicrobium sp. N25]|uniref:sensor domain-containing protein n=1 Tax=Prosthecomicrobium sp. N25 TaxID=3129254 RepID=UPI0030781DB0
MTSDAERSVTPRAERLVRALDLASIVAETDAQGRITYANDRFCEISGYSREELIGSDHRILKSGVHDGRFYEDLYRTIRGGDVWRGEICNRAKDGRLYWVATVIAPFRDETDEIAGYTAIRTEITPQKHAESEARRSEAVSAVMLRGLSAGLVLQDRTGRILMANAGAMAILGLTEAEITGRSSVDPRWRAVREDGSDFPGDEYPAMLALRTGAAQHDVVMGVHLPTGDLRWILVSSEPVFEDAGDPPALALTSFTDITSQKMAEKALADNSGLLQAILDNFPGGVALVDRDLVVRKWNRSYREVLDLPESLFAGPAPSLETLLRYNAGRGEYGPGDPDEQVGVRLALARRFEPHCFERTRPGGQVLETRGMPLPDGGFVTTVVDSTDRRRSETALRASEARFRSIFDLSPVGLALVDLASGRILMQSRALADMLKLTPAAFEGMTLADLLPAGTEFPAQPTGGDGFGPVELDLKRGDGQPVPAIASGRVVQEADGRSSLILVLQDISARRSYEQRLWQLANHDALTGLPNRVQFQMRLHDAIDRGNRTGRSVAVAMFDLDAFKEINDSLGHDAGDELLKTVARRVMPLIRSTDTLARLGGDEFGAIFPDLEDARDIIRPLDAIVEAMKEPARLGAELRRFTTSIGVAVYPSDSKSPAELMKNADLALYRAKAAGRNRYDFFRAEMRVEIDRRTRLRTDLERALDTGALRLVYQPIVAGRSGEVVGLEALLRWNHEEFGLLTPGQFIEGFSDPAISGALGRMVMRLAIGQARRWRAEGIHFGRIAFNVTAADFRTDTLVEDLSSALAEAGVPATDLAIEIKEQLLLGRGVDRIGPALARLHALGVEIAFDDFGTGFASLMHLKQFPIDRIKIDGSFVDRIEQAPEDQAIVIGLVDLAHRLGIETTAERVSTRWQRDFLEGIGCDQIQGYLVSPPLEPEDVPAFLDGQSGIDAVDTFGRIAI